MPSSSPLGAKFGVWPQCQAIYLYKNPCIRTNRLTVRLSRWGWVPNWQISDHSHRALTCWPHTFVRLILLPSQNGFAHFLSLMLKWLWLTYLYTTQVQQQGIFFAKQVKPIWVEALQGLCKSSIWTLVKRTSVRTNRAPSEKKRRYLCRN